MYIIPIYTYKHLPGDPGAAAAWLEGMRKAGPAPNEQSYATVMKARGPDFPWSM